MQDFVAHLKPIADPGLQRIVYEDVPLMSVEQSSGSDGPHHERHCGFEAASRRTLPLGPIGHGLGIIMAVVLVLTSQPAFAEFSIPCLWKPFGGCSVTFVSPEYAARSVQPLDPQSALAAVNAFRAENGTKPLVLDARLSRAAAMQSEAQAGRSWIGHSGSDGSTPKERARRAGYPAKIASENVAAGQKSFSDALSLWKKSPAHRRNLLRPNVSAAGVAMAKSGSGRPYWTLVLGAE